MFIHNLFKIAFMLRFSPYFSGILSYCLTFPIFSCPFLSLMV